MADEPNIAQPDPALWADVLRIAGREGRAPDEVLHDALSAYREAKQSDAVRVAGEASLMRFAPLYKRLAE